jgi:hypothetical protein
MTKEYDEREPKATMPCHARGRVRRTPEVIVLPRRASRPGASVGDGTSVDAAGARVGDER